MKSIVTITQCKLQLTDCVRERPHFLTFHKINNLSTKVNDSIKEVHILLHLGYILHLHP
jgi:hypothetical protein